MPNSRAGRTESSGQALVIMVAAIVAMLAVAGLVVDGGNAWANQRIAQNGSDAAAEAGAVVLAQRLAGATAPVAGWDATVNGAITSSAAGNGITVGAAYYTDICGIPLKSDGSAALTASGAYDFASAQRVGSGLPTVVSSTPDCPNRTVGPVAGVIVLAQKVLQTYLAGVVGLNSISINTQSTAATGYLQESCAATQGEACALLPVAIPVDILSCDGSGNAVLAQPLTAWNADGKTVYKVPLCKNGPGNVGWLDWTPPAGGTSELIQSILTPDNPAIALPSWQYVSATGNVNSLGVETALRTYDGMDVMIPQFDWTCGPGPNGSPSNALVKSPTDNYGCLSATTNDLGGNGSNQWYRIPSFAHFRMCIITDADCAAAGVAYGAYVNGNNSTVCDTGNGATACLVGKFESIVGEGTIAAGFGGGSGNSKAIGVQLLK
jgi:hypothetical protein